ncbi:MAG: tRNA (guanosine(46)-N7)-methyltransferase TrmB [Rikenellaceae bacterium]
MGKDKLRKFAENLTFKCFVQPEFEDIFNKPHPLKGSWRRDFFGNDNPIVLELGCGKGEYTVALAKSDPTRNYIGIDIKGARMWRGAKSATEAAMTNVAFLRTRIEFINSFFAEGEVDEIWITFPDPQLKSRRAKKRLTAPPFLTNYAQFLSTEGAINLKTDSQHLFNYTAEVIRHFALDCEVSNADIYGSGYADATLSIKTAYETMYLERGLPITYTRFRLGAQSNFAMFEWDGDEILKEEKDSEEARKSLPSYPTQSPL